MSKKAWGNGTWYLFHTIAEKIDETYFINNRKYILDIIYKICANLPYPDCANDSTNLYKTANIDQIKTKEDFKQFFFIFHNKVNSKLNKPLFLEKELNKYKLAKTFNIINNFIKVYFIRQYNEKLLIQNFSLIQIKKEIINFLNNLIYKRNIDF